MKIDKGSFINDFIDKNLRQYSIPVYQRNYEWSAEQCEKLFEDIIQAHKLDRYQCITKLGHTYLKFYLQDRPNRLAYLRKARSVEKMLSETWTYLGKARTRASQLRGQLSQYGAY